MPKATRPNYHSAKYILQNDLVQIKDALTRTTSDVKNLTSKRVQNTCSNIKESTLDVHHQVTKYVKTHPFKSLGAALFSGWLMGVILRK